MTTYKRTATLTPSSINTFHECPLKFKRLYIDGAPNVSGPAARRGTKAHEAVARYLRGGDWAACNEWAINTSPEEDRDDLLTIFGGFEEAYGNPPAIIPEHAANVVVEKSFVTDETGVLVDAANGTFGGTVDLAYMTGNVLTVLDWKTGHAVKTNALATDRQMMSYAFLALQAFPDAEYVELVRHYVRYEFGAQGRGEPLKAAEFRGAWQTITQWCEPIFEAIEADEWPCTPNEFCSWCPVNEECPVWQARRAKINGDAIVPDDPREVAELLAAASFVEKRCKDALKKHVEEVGTFHDGQGTWGNWKQNRRVVDPLGVYHAAKFAGATDEEAITAASSTTKMDALAKRNTRFAELVSESVKTQIKTVFKRI